MGCGLLSGSPGRKDLVLVTLENGDAEDDVEATVAALRRTGVRSRIYEFGKGRSNLVCSLGPGSRRSVRRRLLITPHLDTVPAGRGWRGTCLGENG